MSLDITPLAPHGRQIVQAYGDGAFRVSDVDLSGSIIVLGDRTLAWDGELTLEGLNTVVADTPQILVVGCGSDFILPPNELRQALRAHGIVLEWMDTAAACRTYNVLVLEDRLAAAALIAVE